MKKGVEIKKMINETGGRGGYVGQNKVERLGSGSIGTK